MKDKYEQAIEREQTENDYAELFRRNRNSSLKTLILLYRGHYMELFWSVVFFVCKHSPVWILPIVTANIIDATGWRHTHNLAECSVYDRYGTTEYSDELHSYVALCKDDTKCGERSPECAGKKASAAFHCIS